MFSEIIQRRKLFKQLALLSLPCSGELAAGTALIPPIREDSLKKPYRISLNAYSFNSSLSNGSITLDDLLEFCAITGFDAVDLTGYYFPGYPQVPSDEYLYHIKQKAFLLGIAISGTGVRNDFTHPEQSKREADIALIKNWIVAASKLGAPVIRIFSGTQEPGRFSREQVVEWMVRDIRTCVEYGKAHGVMVALQNHFDFIKTPKETKEIIEKVNSDWFGLILDIGSYRGADPYAEIREMAAYAVSWQIKENVYLNGKQVATDLKKIFQIITDTSYRGYLPIETLGPGEPKTKVAGFLRKVREAGTRSGRFI